MKALSLALLVILVTLCSCKTTSPRPYKPPRAKPVNSSHPEEVQNLKIDTISLPDNSPLTSPDNYNIIVFVVCAGLIALVVSIVPISEHFDCMRRKKAGLSCKKSK